jgi:hypothetical protein
LRGGFEREVIGVEPALSMGDQHAERGGLDQTVENFTVGLIEVLRDVHHCSFRDAGPAAA